MTKADFEHNLSGADVFRKLAEPGEEAYWGGYQRGLRKNFHGVNFGTAEEDVQWSGRADLLGDGYRDGKCGLPIAEAIEKVKAFNQKAIELFK